MHYLRSLQGLRCSAVKQLVNSQITRSKTQSIRGMLTSNAFLEPEILLAYLEARRPVIPSAADNLNARNIYLNCGSLLTDSVSPYLMV